MRRSRENKRNKLLQMYHVKMKNAPLALFKVDHHLLSVLYDQYKRAMEIFNDDKKLEDEVLERALLRSARPKKVVRRGATPPTSNEDFKALRDFHPKQAGVL